MSITKLHFILPFTLNKADVDCSAKSFPFSTKVPYRAKRKCSPSRQEHWYEQLECCRLLLLPTAQSLQLITTFNRVFATHPQNYFFRGKPNCVHAWEIERLAIRLGAGRTGGRDPKNRLWRRCCLLKWRECVIKSEESSLKENGGW